MERSSVVGETTRSPNRVYLIRRIKEAIATARLKLAQALESYATQKTLEPQNARRVEED
jgi:hypothetical protein